MKKHLVAMLVLPVAIAAADEPSFAFPEQKIALPPLSLAARSMPPYATFLNDATAWFRRQNPPAIATRKFVSHMPIVYPKAEVDSRMPIKLPDSSTDYKLIVQTPNVEPAK